MSDVIFSLSRRNLRAAPIKRDWILDGAPEAKGHPLFETSDRGANVHEWECSRGRFEWHYECDEIVHVVEGDARIKDLATGLSTNITAGSSVLFQRGSSAEWTIDHYIRKIAVNHVPLSPNLIMLRAAWHRLKRLFGKSAQAQNGGLSGFSLGDKSPAT
jgi:uncharacterized cupin superfamily protein